MKSRWMKLALVVTLCAGILCACAPAAKPVAAVPEEEVTLIVAGSWADCRAIDEAANAFKALYPNCTIVYEYLQDYYDALEKRTTGDEPVDLFMTTNIQADSPMLPYALDLKSRPNLDLSQTFDGLIENFAFRDSSGEKAKLYAVPLGAEMRGLYVNVTLLSSLGLKVPVDQASLLDACAVLKDNGYIPFHGNPGSFSQQLMYPWICSVIANAKDPKAAYDRVNGREPGMSEMFREPYEFLYTLVEKDYYDYKTAQTELNLFNETRDVDFARFFLNIVQKDGEEGAYEKADDIGQVAFMPAAMSLQSVITKTKEDYHSGIDYVFIPAPVGPQGGFVYLSPAHGIAVNKHSAHLDWCDRFLSFLFQPANNEVFAKTFNVIPNTKKAFTYVQKLYSVPDERISQLGQVTFDYDFYGAITKNMVDLSKGNNPKYMQDDGKGGLSLYPLAYYMDELEVKLRQE